MFDFEIAFYLYKMARIQSVFLDSKYKAKAYFSAAMAIDAHDTYVQTMYRSHELKNIPYVGNSIGKCIAEIIESGEWQELKKYEEEYQIKDYSLLLIHGLSELIIKKLWEGAIRSIKDLQNDKCQKKIGEILSNGERKKVDSYIKEYVDLNGMYLQAYGDCLGNELLEYLRQMKGVLSAEFCGEMASASEKISSIDIAFTYQGKWPSMLKQLKKFQRVTNIQGKEFKEITGLTAFGIPFRLVYQEYGEQCIDLQSIRGDLHIHTNWTDGIHSIEEMLLTAGQRGYEYLAITDHSVSMRVAHGLSESQALSQIQELRELEKKYHIHILAGVEVDIRADGSLDYSDEVLCQFDFVIAAIHSHMTQPPVEMERRLRKALSNPYVNILAHPTGRLLGRPGVLFSDRAAYQLGITSIINLCKEYRVVLEVNCFPERLDLSAEHAKMAVEKGVRLSLGTDSHSLAHMRNIEYGARMLQSVGIRKGMVLNTYSYSQLMDFFGDQRPKIAEENIPIIKKNKKDFAYYFGNDPDIIEGKKRIIGIDLTGNEEKESGWAYLAGQRAECRRIKTDEELIESICRLKPDVVSIDSPLAYPRRRCCARKDCECSKYGIMRESERMLRHFGITVYPCLIDSMVNLTTRGMKLAKRLREMGYTVIESYPGVAQDVLMIPRKGKTKEQFVHLKQGLASFGILGDLISNPQISHDEVDAITSALVGYFYLNGQYVGLGNEDEDYLIVPRIQEDMLHKRVIVGLCGETGAGKTTVTEYLKFKYGLQSFRYSQVIAEKYQVTDKKELQYIGADIARDEKKQRELSRYMIDHMKEERGYVVDGLRHFEDYDELRGNFNDKFVLIFIQCRYKNRRARYQKLHFEQVTDEDFQMINDHVSEQDIGLLQMRADYCVDNNRGYKDLWEQIDQIIDQKSGGNV